MAFYSTIWKLLSSHSTAQISKPVSLPWVTCVPQIVCILKHTFYHYWANSLKLSCCNHWFSTLDHMYHHCWTSVQVHASGPYTACAPELPCLKCIACILLWSRCHRFAEPVVFSILLQIHRLQVRECCQWLLGLYSRAHVQSLLSLCSTVDMTQMLRLNSGACALALLKSSFVTCLCHLLTLYCKLMSNS